MTVLTTTPRDRPLVDLDHAGIISSDLNVARETYSLLGFKLTGLSMHAGSREPGGPVVQMGSGNHCAMFEYGYLEIAGIVEPHRFSNMQSMLDQYAGLHIVALGLRDADEGYSLLSARGAPVAEPRRLQRDAPFGPEARETRRVAFRNLYVERGAWPEAQFLAIEHLTRETLWQQHLLDHPNGVLRLQTVWMCSADPLASALRIGAGLGATLVGDATSDRTSIALTHGELVLVSPKEWQKWSRTAPPIVPAPVGMQFIVRSMSATARYFANRGVPIERGPAGELVVAPAQACGVLLSFVEAPAWK